MFAASKSGSADAKDPQFNYVTMLLHGNGTNGSQNNTFVDSSTNNFTITRNGNTTQGTFTPYGSNWSNYFDGSGDYLTAGSSISLSGDFTVEGWCYPTSSSGNGYYLFGLGNDYFSTGATFFITTSGYLRIYTGNANILSGTSGVVQLNTWNHIAFVRSGTTVKAYLNGVQVDSATLSGTISGTAYINAELNGNPTATVYAGSAGYYSNVRISTTAVYTTAFTPSTTPLTAITGTQLLTCQSNRFIDNSTNNFTITKNGDTSVQRFSPFSPTTAYSTSVIGGSGYFDGSGDYLTTASSTSLQAGTGAFTLEGWIYVTGTTSGSILSQIPDINSGYGIGIVYEAGSNLLTGVITTTSTTAWSGSVTAVKNAWYHMAFVRDASTNIALFINGVKVTPTTGGSTNTTNITTATTFVSGPRFYDNPTRSTFQLGGYVSDARFIKGSAAYDPTQSTITVPTAPLTAITNTQLLLSYTNAGILDNAMMNDLETVGNAQISTSVKKYGTGSMYFDGTGDYLTAPSNAYFAIGATEDYTVECWVNFSVVQTCGFYQATNNISSATGQFWFGYEGGQLKSSQHGSSTYAVGYTWSPSTGTWYHVAATRASGTVRLFINGTVVTTNTTTQNGVSFTQSGAAVGVLTTPSYMNGYIDDLRITKGYARYTANFTAPTAAFADKG